MPVTATTLGFTLRPVVTHHGATVAIAHIFTACYENPTGILEETMSHRLPQ